MEKVRAFIAIELSADVRKELAELQAKLKEAGADVKWMKPESVHLTLKFLGSVAEDKLKRVKAVLDKIASNYEPFKISLFKIGCFPKLDYPRVVWVGIDKGCAETEEIAKSLEEELVKIGFEKEKRPFSAHLTLGRVRSPKNRKALVEKIRSLENVGAYCNTSLHQMVTELVLFKSTLTPQGSIYTPLHKSPL